MLYLSGIIERIYRYVRTCNGVAATVAINNRTSDGSRRRSGHYQVGSGACRLGRKTPARRGARLATPVPDDESSAQHQLALAACMQRL
jgi:hypothetical protein